MMEYSGHFAALGAALAWSISAVCWTSSGRRVGSLVVNTLRLFIAFPIFLAYGHFVLGEAVPLSAPAHAWLWLSISGVTGFFLCDLCLFRSFLLIGVRHAMLIFSLAPLVASLGGRLALNERLSPLNLAGMVITIGGVMWVVSESRGPGDGALPAQERGSVRRGCLLAFAAMLLQACSGVLSKIGMKHLASAAAATEIRLISGMACFALLMLILRQYPAMGRALRQARTMGIILTGTLSGPFLGVTLLMFALQRISTGLAMTFVSMTPIFVIPFTVVLFHERVSPRAVVGTMIAFAGLALLFVR